MRRALVAIAFAALAGPASAEPVNDIMVQPNAPIRVVGCSATELRTRTDGTNVRERGSFESVGPRTANAVRIGFVYFDALGGRSVHSVLVSGTYSPGARIDLPPYAGRIGAETTRVVCYAMQASFTDGTRWTATAMPRAESATAPVGEVPSIPTEVLAQAGAPVSLDGCDVTGPTNGYVTTALRLTNVAAQPVRRTDVSFVFYDANQIRTEHREYIVGSYPPGATFTGGIRIPAASASKIYCTVGRVTFDDAATAWSAPAGYLTGATSP